MIRPDTLDNLQMELAKANREGRLVSIDIDRPAETLQDPEIGPYMRPGPITTITIVVKHPQ